MRELAAEFMAESADPDHVHVLFARETGSATPKVDVRVAVFREGLRGDEILLVRKPED